MRQHFILPSRRPAQSDSVSASKPLARRHSRLFGTSLPKTPAQSRSASFETPKSGETTKSDHDEEVKLRKASSLVPIHDEEAETPEPVTRSSSAWGFGPQPLWQEISKMSGNPDGDTRDSSCSSSITTMPPPALLQINDNDHEMMNVPKYDLSGPIPSMSEMSRHLRKTSSSYPSQGKASTRIQSPESMFRPNKLSHTDLSRFSKANDRLSNLRSTLSSDEYYDRTMSTNPLEVMEAVTAIMERQGQSRPQVTPYNQYELVESTEVLPSDSASQHSSPSGAHLAIDTCSPSKKARGLTWESMDTIDGQYDGANEANNRLESSASTVRSPSTPADQEHIHKKIKRKASVFSLHSLANPLSKHPKLGLRKWASSVYHQGSQKLSQARLKWICPTRQDRRMFEAWRMRRRGTNSESSPCKEKSDRNSGIFSSEGRVCANEDWWMDGVKMFEAPKWMNFGGFSRS
ncbi:hypothetical protein HDV62DRAFT_390456 [Trichoderma sp. SZMC 28011]